MIEQDPEGFAEQFDQETLQQYIDLANDIYHNSEDPTQVGLSDYAYDCLVYWVTKMSKKTSMDRSKIGALPRAKNCVQLPYLMPSLDKVKIGRDLETFLQNETITWSLKLDGISAMIIYKDGEPSQCFLRGNGVYGSDISFILEHIKLPRTNLYPNLVVRGELIVPKKFWNESFGKASKATARNWVSGILNSNFVSPYLHYIEFIAYQAVTPLSSDLSSFTALEKEGFAVAKHGVLEHKLSAYVLMLYKEYLEQYEYMIDGVVLSSDDKVYQAPVKVGEHVEIRNPKHCVAFKINLQDQMRETIITGVDWSFTRHGRLMPVAEFRPVFIDGARIHRAFVYNASTCIKKLQLGVGTKVVVTRSGGVIPTIVKVSEQIGEPCQPQIQYPWHWSGCDIALDDPDTCPEVILRRHVHFFETLEIPGIREGMLKKIMDSGLLSLKDIVTASKERLRTVPGIGPKRSESYYTGIREGLSSTYLYRLMLASNTFPSGIGKAFLRQIIANIPSVLSQCSTSQLVALKGIGKVRAAKILEGLESFKAFLTDFPIDISKLKTSSVHNASISGKTFVLTGIEDDTVEDFILDNGGYIASKVESTTDALITGNIRLLSEKQQTAFKLNIKIYTWSELGGGNPGSPLTPLTPLPLWGN